MDRLPVALCDQQRVLRIAGLEHRVAARLQDLAGEIAHLRLVLHQQHRLVAARHGGRHGPRLLGGGGLDDARQVDLEPGPRPTSLSSWMSPPLCLTMPYTVERPSPVPLPGSLVVKNGSNTRVRVASSMPVPVSVTASTT